MNGEEKTRRGGKGEKLDGRGRYSRILGGRLFSTYSVLGGEPPEDPEIGEIGSWPGGPRPLRTSLEVHLCVDSGIVGKLERGMEKGDLTR